MKNVKKRALFISSRPIYPVVDGYRIRTAQQLEFLAGRYDVDVVYLHELKKDDVTRQHLPAVGNVVCFHMPKYRNCLSALSFLFNPLPLQVNFYYSRKMWRFIKNHITEYDLVFCNNIRTAEYVRKEKDIRKYIDFVDAISMNYEKAKEVAHGMRKIIYAIEYERCKKYEQKVLNEFGCAVISEIDRRYILGKRQKQLYTVGNKVDIPDSERISKHEHPDTIVFVGKMDYEPNVVAVTWFADHVFPKLCMDRPDLKFVIVGVKPDIRVQKLTGRKNITVTGYVESVEPFYQKATIVVAPMLTGAGIQNKIIQAMSYGCCVVTTPIGAEGLQIENNEIAVVDSAGEMIEMLALLLNDREKRLAMGRAAREYAKNNLSEEIVGRQFWEFMDG